LRQRTLVVAYLFGSPGVLTSDIFPGLTPADIAAIDSAGEKGARRETFIKIARVVAGLMLFGAVIFRIYALLEPCARYSWSNVC
jgi:hypothetical protein